LLGVDAYYQGEQIAKDLNEPGLYALIQKYGKVKVLLSVIGGQGVILGRGNQQISARILRRITRNNLQFVATKSKLLALHGRPLRVDTGDDLLDRELAGTYPIITGYEESLFYALEYAQ